MGALRRLRGALRRPIAAALGSVVGVVLLILCLAVQAQTPAPDPPYTFHVYEDLVQVPTLVLNSLHGSYRGLTTDHFLVRLDSGPPFHPRHIRLEGEDPITLALLLDASNKDTDALLKTLNNALRNFPANWLTTRDTISIFAVDCSLVRSGLNVPFSAENLDTGVRAALAAPALHALNGSPAPCSSTRRLWDTLAAVTGQIRFVSGRRVVLVITDGLDHGSSNTWKNLQLYAENYSVTIMGVRPDHALVPLASTGGSGHTIFQSAHEVLFDMLCGGTGGTVLPADARTLTPQMQRVVDLLRDRYILEFARPSNGTAGVHTMDVTIPDASAIVRPSGIAVPLKDKALLARPDSVPTDSSRAPEMGERRILTQPK